MEPRPVQSFVMDRRLGHCQAISHTVQHIILQQQHQEQTFRNGWVLRTDGYYEHHCSVVHSIYFTHSAADQQQECCIAGLGFIF